MPAKVTLKITEGKLKGHESVFDERSTCIIGRDDDCLPRVPKDDDHKTISRHHCLLDINPPDIRVRDFGSMNGTWVNGTKIGQREKGMSPEDGQKMAFPEYDLKHGDQIKLGNTVFQVNIFVPTRCAECSAEIAEEQKARLEKAPGIYQCQSCQKRAETAQRKDPPKKKAKVCAKCGKDVAGEVGENRQGEFVCSLCKADPMAILKHLLAMANTGDKGLAAIQGYAILKELGRGGMGAVYLALHEKSAEQVALKVMLPRVAVEDRSKDMFLRETENTKAFEHPNVVELRDNGCSQGTFYFFLRRLTSDHSIVQLLLDS